MDKVRLCKDCRHFLSEDRCGKDQMPPDYVYGKERDYYMAQSVRESSSDCGPQARWFEPKEAA